MDDMGMDESSLLDGLETVGDEDDMMDDLDGAQGGKTLSLQRQSILALQEFGIVIGVALLVGVIFMLMIYLEKFWNSVSDFYHKRFGDYKEDDEEDPAALVGTFKRYKN